ncbi:MAG: peptidase and chymotrypsin/Hap, partial [Myxococcaceae bacterium]|nr:peptidase and chymotrypsin/Hap [Myxococcaceae bacterium]
MNSHHQRAHRRVITKRTGSRAAAWSCALLAVAGVELESSNALAISGGTAATEPAYAPLVKLTVGASQSCSGVLVHPLWVVTAASCFKVGDQPIAVGAPSQPTTAIVGRQDLGSSSGQVVSVTHLVPSPDRNLVLARLSRRIDQITPVAVATTPPAVGEKLRVAGYGRTAKEWMPELLQVAGFSVQSVNATTLGVAGDAANTCKGDSGAPTLRERDGALELVAIATTSFQSGCLGETDRRTSATQARVDDLAEWISKQTNARHQYGSIQWTSAVTCSCWDRDCWGGSCSGASCEAKQQCQRPATTYDVKTGDYDADGKADLLTLSPNANGSWTGAADLEFFRSDHFESKRWPMETPAHMRRGGADAYYRTLQGDFNGDGRSDLATISPDGTTGWGDWLAVELAKDGGFDSQTWPAKTPLNMRLGGQGAYLLTAGDFNGDGKTDVATLSPNASGGWADHIAIELAGDHQFDSKVWTAGTPIHMHNGGDAAYIVLPGDFNGDGKTDLATVSPNGGGSWSDWFAVELAKEGGFDSRLWPSQTPMLMRTGGSAAKYHVVAADFTGDGKTDIATVSPGATGLW